jgi:hypothetical protein
MEFTPTQQRILKILSDGRPHSITELRTALNDELAVRCALKVHICHIRKKLRPIGQDILFEITGKIDGTYYSYRHVRLLQG